MSIVLDARHVCNPHPGTVPPGTPPASVVGDWRAAARNLSLWAFPRLVNRVDAYGGHREDGGRFTSHEKLRPGRLDTHFGGGRRVGLHAISKQNTSKWVLIDIDAHGDGDTTATVAENFAAALEICRRAIALGLNPLLSDSNGRGGYHVRVIFSRPIPAADAYHFGRWLARGYSPNESGGVEVFPNRPDRNTGKGFGGGWVRLYGRHHKRDHWTRAWDWRQKQWLDGAAAVAILLAHTGDDPAKLAGVDYMPPPPAPPPPAPPRTQPTGRPANVADQARRYLAKVPPAVSGQRGHDATFHAACVLVKGFGLRPTEALPVLQEWNQGCLPPWSDRELLHKLADADKAPDSLPRGHLVRTPADPKSPCGLFAFAPLCPLSSVQEQTTVRAIRDKEALLQTIRRVSAKYSTSPWDCPHSFGVAGCRRNSPALLPATCRKRDCPVCGPHWRKVTFERFAHHIAQHSGPLFTDCIPDLDWAATLKTMRRGAKADGQELRFVAVRDPEGLMMVIASVAPSPFARQVDQLEAVQVLERAVDGADTAPRPVSACRAWGRIDAVFDPDEKIERVPGGATPTAFRETLREWGAEAVGRGSVIRCGIANLFVDPDTGQFDFMAQADFWREAELYTDCGSAAAADFRQQAAKRRAAVKIAATRETARQGGLWEGGT